MSNRIVLLACGSFNPITIMHLRLFEVARDYLNRKGYQVVAGVISPVGDSYSKKDLVAAEHRCAMIDLALQSSDWIRLDRWEAEQKTWLETVKILRKQREKYKSQIANKSTTPVIEQKSSVSNSRKRKISETSLVNNNDNQIDNRLVENDSQPPPLIKLLCGADLLESFAVPGLWAEEDMEEIVSQFGIVCITRAGSNVEKFIYENDLLSRYSENISIVTEHMYNDISSTKIRRALKRRESVKYLLPDSVIEYINAKNLYRENK